MDCFGTYFTHVQTCSKCYGMDCFGTYFTHVQTRNVTRVQISDGAPCYPKLKRELKVLHRSVSHAKGEFVKKDKIHGCQVSIHTGEIDNVWNAIKSAIPNSLTTKSKGEVNPLLLQYARQWQWRWSNSRSSNLALATARYFRDL